MKILINTYQAAFITPGGGEVQLCQTYEHLKSCNIDVDLYNQWQPNLQDYDIVHYFSVFGGSLYFCEMVKALGKKLVVSPVIWLDGDDSKYPIDEIKAILDLADLILPNSNLEAEMLNQKLSIPKEKIQVVYNAVEPDVFKAIDKNLFKNKYGFDKYILNVANIEQRKNQYKLIKAMQGVNLPLVIIGHIRDRDYYEKCKAISDAEKTFFLAPLEYNSPLLLSAFAGAELFALPSTLETPGLAALEAAAAGCKKIVITPNGCTREYFAGYAEYVKDINDSESIQESILRKLAEDRDDSNLRENIVRKFSWHNTARQTKEAYEKVMNIK